MKTQIKNLIQTYRTMIWDIAAEKTTKKSFPVQRAKIEILENVIKDLKNYL